MTNINCQAVRLSYKSISPHRESRKKLWGLFIKYRAKFQVSLEISWEMLPGNWKYWSNLRVLTTFLCSSL
jgi:hypothetical protein